MAITKVKFDDGPLRKALTEATAESLINGATHYQTRLQQVVGSPGASSPGQPPGLQSGQGQKSIVQEVEIEPDNMTARVGVSLEGLHLYLLEQGTTTTGRRPWLVSTLEKEKQAIAKLFAAPAD